MTIKELEGRYTPAPDGQFYLIKNEKYHTPLGSFPLLSYGAGTLQIMLTQSISEQEFFERLNQERLDRLMAGSVITFGPAQTHNEGEAQRHFGRLSPEESMKLLGEIYGHYAKHFNDQQKELARVAG